MSFLGAVEYAGVTFVGSLSIGEEKGQEGGRNCFIRGRQGVKVRAKKRGKRGGKVVGMG